MGYKAKTEGGEVYPPRPPRHCSSVQKSREVIKTFSVPYCTTMTGTIGLGFLWHPLVCIYKNESKSSHAKQGWVVALMSR